MKIDVFEGRTDKFHVVGLVRLWCGINSGVAAGNVAAGGRGMIVRNDSGRDDGRCGGRRM